VFSTPVKKRVAGHPSFPLKGPSAAPLIKRAPLFHVFKKKYLKINKNIFFLENDPQVFLSPSKCFKMTPYAKNASACTVHKTSIVEHF
jgi:hypothetical protein